MTTSATRDSRIEPRRAARCGRGSCMHGRHELLPERREAPRRLTPRTRMTSRLVASARATSPVREVLAIVVAGAMLVGLVGCGPSSRASRASRADQPSPLLAPIADPLPSWREGASKQAILDLVARATDEDGPDFVPPADRIAVFDNDGTLWAEQPVYVQIVFAIDHVKATAAQHPEWRETEPHASILRGDRDALRSMSGAQLVALASGVFGGMTTEEYRDAVTAWLSTARHPETGLRYEEMVYQPMLEVLAHLRANGFRTYIVSGGGFEFVRPLAERVYGIPPEQVLGSIASLRFEEQDGVPVLVKGTTLEFLNDKEGKAIAIERMIGRRPVVAFGNSDGDVAMLEWTSAGEGARLGVLIHHTDAAREWAYDRGSAIGTLDVGLAEAGERGWTVVDMARDWSTVFPSAVVPR